MTFLTGYLGAGKTSMINEVLALADRPVAVFVNDVGEINLDARLVRRRHGDTIELTDGCVCCSLSNGFGEAFDQLRARSGPPDHLIVELSGVADPNRVLPWATTAGFRLDGVIALVDAERFDAQINDRVIGPGIAGQIRAADLVVLTRGDLVPKSVVADVAHRIEDLFRGSRPETSVGVAAPLVLASSDRAWSLAGLVGLGGRRPGGLFETPPITLFDLHTVGIVPVPQPIERADLDALLDGLPRATVRAKGVSIDRHGQRWLVQVVGTRRSITQLPASERQDPTDLVVIQVRQTAEAGAR
ncbi:MAG: CobW family GTP-binding protein [Actinomycetota bacterium]|nr:CobW family GTP-binding protein [Actinomycetota bacterium]